MVAPALRVGLCAEDWGERFTRLIYLDDWREPWTPGLMPDGARVAVFPDPLPKSVSAAASGAAGILPEPDRLAEDIQNETNEFR